MKIGILVLAGWISLLSNIYGAVEFVPDTSGNKKLEFEYAFSEATKQYIFGDYRQAMALYKHCIAYNPRHAASFFQMANIYLMAGDSKNALDNARNAHELEKGNKYMALLLAKCYQLNDRNDSALIVYKELIDQEPDNLDYWFEYAGILGSTSRYQEALKIYDQIESKIGLNEGISLAKQQIFVDHKLYKNAILELNKLVRAFPEETRYKGILAEMYASVNKNDSAGLLYRQILNTDSTNTLALISVADFYRVTKQYRESFVAIKKVLRDSSVALDSKIGVLMGYLQNPNDFKANTKDLRDVIGILLELNSNNIRLNTILVDYCMKTAKVDSALQIMEKVLMQDGNPGLWEQYFIIMNTAGLNDKIIESREQGLSSAPESATIYLILGMAYLQKERVDEALNILKEGAEKTKMDDQQKEQYYEVMGEAGFKTKDYVSSDSSYEIILKIDQKNAMALNNYSYFLAIRNEKLDKAKEMSERAVELKKGNATYLDTYAFVLMKLHKYRRAYKYMEKAVEIDKGKDPDILEHMGDVLHYLHKDQKAVKYWKLAIEKGKKDLDIEGKMKLK